MGETIEVDSGRVSGVDGVCSWRVQVTKNASGETVVRVLQEARIDGRAIGSDHADWDRIAQHVRAV